MSDVQTFTAVIETGAGGGAFVIVPAGVVEALGGRGRVAVRASFDGVAYTGSVVSMGGQSVLGMLKRIRAELGKDVGDTVEVTVEVDTSERTVMVPDDLAAALSDAGLTGAFDALSYSHRREHVTSIEEAKKPTTRARRIAVAVERLRS